MKYLKDTKCEHCKHVGHIEPIIYTIKVYKYEDGRRIDTGRVKKLVSHLECEICGNTSLVDDDFGERLLNE